MDEELKKLFTKDIDKLKQNNIVSRDFSEICSNLRLYRKKLLNEDKEKLLEAVDFMFGKCYIDIKPEYNSLFDRLFNVIKRNKESEEIKWADRNRDYFSGNLVGDDEFSLKYKKIFSGAYKLSDLRDYLKDMVKNERYYNNDFYLRNVEVILRDDVTFDKTYNHYGEILAKKIESICN